ncbi:MAG: peroxide stress protein YaaA [Xenococcus sp. MO_188.B8]|nr:peroxide stress protein YaaA [Xenococcus sp. MO_188.B8]
MLILISPAKTLDFETPSNISLFTQPDFLEETSQLVNQLRQLSATEISALLKISPKLGELNSQRYQTWQQPFAPSNAKQALFAFKGDVYQGLDVESFSQEDINFSQEHLIILSGLYGILRPLDLIQPYRLEMGTKFNQVKNPNFPANLYEFWGDQLTQVINSQLDKQNNKVIINLASNEYFKVVNKKILQGKIITPIFKDWKNGKYKIISFYAKKARGLMAAYIIKNQLENFEEIKNFAQAGYAYNLELSTDNQLIFTRSEDNL